MARVLILGGSFAGQAAAEVLARRRDVELTLCDRLPAAEFRPLLPDVVGAGLPAELLRFDLSAFARRLDCSFVCREVLALDLKAGRAATAAGDLEYDFLVLAAGSEPKFLGGAGSVEHMLGFHDLADAGRLLERLGDPALRNLVVIGGGYTGAELASHLQARAIAGGRPWRVILLEITPRILPSLPERLSRCTQRNLVRMGVEVRTSTTASRIGPREVELSGGEVLSEALAVWSASVQAGAVVRTLPAATGPNRRLEVDARLRFAPNAFACGDAAAVHRGGEVMRMGVQLAISGGRCAAGNVLRLIRGRPLRDFSGSDPGVIVPMANGRSCARVLGVRLGGRLPTWLHYFMSCYRTRGLRRRLALARALARR